MNEREKARALEWGELGEFQNKRAGQKQEYIQNM